MATPDHQERAPRLDLPVACALDVRNTLGESPVWSPAEKALYRADILEATVHRWEPASGAHAAWRVPEAIQGLGLRERGGLVLAMRNGFHLFDPGAANSPSSTIPSPTSQPTG